MNRKRGIFFLVILVLIFFAVNYGFLNEKITGFAEESDTGIVERVVDGDTAIINGNSTRLLGVNTPERGEKYYQEAKSFLEMVALNKTVKLVYGGERRDRYGRVLAYIFIDGKSVNKELVDEGYANFYFPSGKDSYYSSFVKAWEHCLANNKYICEKSTDECAKCVELKKLDVAKQEIIFYNNCSFSCSLNVWTIKDEGRKKFIFGNFILEANEEVSVVVGNKTNTENTLYWRNEEYVWTQGGDTLFLRDEEGKLVLWKNY